MVLARRKVSERGRDATSSGKRPGDRRTGYYVAGRDWPAISNDLKVAEIYKALEEIEDEDVEAAMSGLRAARDPLEQSSAEEDR